MKETNGTEFENTNEVSGDNDIISERVASEPVSDAKTKTADSYESGEETDQSDDSRKSIFVLLEEDIMSSDLSLEEHPPFQTDQNAGQEGEYYAGRSYWQRQELND